MHHWPFFLPLPSFQHVDRAENNKCVQEALSEDRAFNQVTLDAGKSAPPFLELPQRF